MTERRFNEETFIKRFLQLTLQEEEKELLRLLRVGKNRY
jgi:hypothetical protein